MSKATLYQLFLAGIEAEIAGMRYGMTHSTFDADRPQYITRDRLKAEAGAFNAALEEQGVE